MIENMTAESARSILNYLLESGKITKDDVHNGLIERPTPEMMRVVDFIHTMLCTLPHDQEVDYACRYPVEEGYDGCWKGTAHRRWLQEAVRIMRELEIGSESEFLRVYNQTKRILDLVAELQTKEPATVQLAWILLDLLPAEEED